MTPLESKEKTMTDINQYTAAESRVVDTATDMILGGKDIPAVETVVGDPDTMHRPEQFAQCDE